MEFQDFTIVPDNRMIWMLSQNIRDVFSTLTCGERRVGEVALGDQQLGVELLQLRLQLRQLRDGLLHNVVHIRHRLFILRHLAQVLRPLLNLQGDNWFCDGRLAMW